MIPINIVIADDHPAYREGLAAKLNETPDIRVVGQASNGQELLCLVEETKPDLVLTDIQMGKMGGIEAARLIRERFPHIFIVAVSGFYDNYMVMEMLRAGATGYVVKTADVPAIADIIRKTYRGEESFCETADRVISSLVRTGRFNLKTLQVYELTPREVSIVRMLCNNLSAAEIATRLNTSLEAVKSSRKIIYRKIGKSGLPALIEFALRNGIHSLEEQ